jgi:transposase
MLEKKDLKPLIDKGWSATKIAAHLGCSINRVCKWSKFHGINPNWRSGSRHHGAKATESQISTGLSLIEDGWTVKAAAQEIKVPYNVLMMANQGRSWTHV